MNVEVKFYFRGILDEYCILKNLMLSYGLPDEKAEKPQRECIRVIFDRQTSREHCPWRHLDATVAPARHA